MNTSYIQKHVKTIITKSKDDCVISLINKLIDSCNNKNGINYLQTISEISKISDGYVSEYFDEVGSKLFYTCFDKLFPLIYTKNSQFNNPLEKIIIQSIGSEISDAKNPQQEKKKIETFVMQKSLKFGTEKRRYLTNLVNKIYEFAEQS